MPSTSSRYKEIYDCVPPETKDVCYGKSVNLEIE